MKHRFQHLDYEEFAKFAVRNYGVPVVDYDNRPAGEMITYSDLIRAASEWGIDLDYLVDTERYIEEIAYLDRKE